MDWFQELMDLFSGNAYSKPDTVYISPGWLKQLEGFLQDFTGIDVPDMMSNVTHEVTPEDLINSLSAKVNSLIDAVVKEYNAAVTSIGEIDKKISTANDLLEKNEEDRRFMAEMATTFPFYHSLRRANIKFLQEASKPQVDVASLEKQRADMNSKAEGYAAKRDQLTTLASDVATLQSASGFKKGSQEWKDQYKQMYDKYYGLLHGSKTDSDPASTVVKIDKNAPMLPQNRYKGGGH